MIFRTFFRSAFGVATLVIGYGLAVGLAGCNSNKPSAPQVGQPPVNPQAESPSPQDLTATSAKSPPILMSAGTFSLTDQSGEILDSEQLLGKAWVVNFMFTRCRSTTPVQTARLVELQDELQGRKTWRDIRFVSISVDPQHDTPQVLSQYAAQAKVDSQHWKFLTGARDDIWQLANQGFKMPVEASQDSQVEVAVIHSDKFALVDPQGHVRGFYESGKAAELERLKQDLELALDERVLIFDDLLEPAWLASRRQAQLDKAGESGVFNQFSFTDRIRESGIRFRHRIVDDAGREHKACHYDHGNGLGIADVNGDGLSDVYFVNQVGDNELWKNRGDGTFEDITATAGVGVPNKIHVSATFADIDNDGDPDLYVTNVRSENVLLENDGTGKFVDITQRSGLGFKGHSSAAVFFDYNRDGLLDVFLVNVGVYTSPQSAAVVKDRFSGPDDREHNYFVAYPDAFAGHLKPERSERSLLYENKGGNRFEEVSRKMGLLHTAWSGDASPVDANEDGWLDLYVVNMQGHDEYYENVKGERFVKKSRELFPATPWGAMGIKVFDFDNDGRQDIYVTDMHTDMGESVDADHEKLKARKEQFPLAVLNTDGNHVWGNAFFHKQPDGSYKEISDEIGAETYWPWGLSTGDLNADGFEDVFVAGSMNFPFRYGINSVLLNDRGRKLLDSEFILGVEPRRAGRTAIPWFELDVAGKDSAIAQAYKLKGGKSTRLVAWGALGTRSSVIFDLDNDGDLDIITNDLNSEPMVLVSNLNEKSSPIRFLKVRLVGRKSNRDGLGATVRVQTGSQTLSKVHDGKSGYLSQSSYPLYFGLGDAEAVDRIEVRWPSGRTQIVTDAIRLNSLLEITEPESDASEK